MGSQVARTSQAKVYLATDADYFHTDTLSLVAGEYTVTEVKYYDKKRQNLLLVTNPNIEITVAPNVLNKQDIDVTYPENMKAISDIGNGFHVFRIGYINVLFVKYIRSYGNLDVRIGNEQQILALLVIILHFRNGIFTCNQ